MAVIVIPKAGLGFIQELQEHLNKTTGKIATVTAATMLWTVIRDGKG